MTREEMNQIKEERGYSFRLLAEYTGIPAVTLQKIFSGKTKNPRQAATKAIECVLLAPEEIYRTIPVIVPRGRHYPVHAGCEGDL